MTRALPTAAQGPAPAPPHPLVGPAGPGTESTDTSISSAADASAAFFVGPYRALYGPGAGDSSFSPHGQGVAVYLWLESRDDHEMTNVSCRIDSVTAPGDPTRATPAERKRVASSVACF